MSTALFEETYYINITHFKVRDEGEIFIEHNLERLLLLLYDVAHCL